jgi:hypothetical protein
MFTILLDIKPFQNQKNFNNLSKSDININFYSRKKTTIIPHWQPEKTNYEIGKIIEEYKNKVDDYVDKLFMSYNMDIKKLPKALKCKGYTNKYKGNYNSENTITYLYKTSYDGEMSIVLRKNIKAFIDVVIMQYKLRKFLVINFVNEDMHTNFIHRDLQLLIIDNLPPEKGFTNWMKNDLLERVDFYKRYRDFKSYHVCNYRQNYFNIVPNSFEDNKYLFNRKDVLQKKEILHYEASIADNFHQKYYRSCIENHRCKKGDFCDDKIRTKKQTLNKKKDDKKRFDEYCKKMNYI